MKKFPIIQNLPKNPESQNLHEGLSLGHFPSWLHRKIPEGFLLEQTKQAIEQERLFTVCEEAKCPNLLECWSKKTATFLALGKSCTRNCGFCSIDFSKTPQPIDPFEPEKIAKSIILLGLKHAVITMVARDDLEDGGAIAFCNIISEIQKKTNASIEVLTSDFSGNKNSWDLIIQAKPQIFNHNLETVKRLSSKVRHKATYERSLSFLEYVKKNSQIIVKSGIMVGLGETKEEVFETLVDLAKFGCDIVTIGQYLQPDRNKLLVKEFISPEQFKVYEEFGKLQGINHMYCGPFVRSSYHAEEVYDYGRN